MNALWIALVAATPIVIAFVMLGLAHVEDGGSWRSWSRVYPRFLLSLALIFGSVAALFFLISRVL